MLLSDKHLTPPRATTYRDYAATYGYFEQISRELNITQARQADLIYALYLDDPMLVAAQRQRFGTGVLVGGSEKSIKAKVLSMNAAIAKLPPVPTSEAELAHQMWAFSDLPSVDAAVIQFPSTYGFVSALITSYRVSTSSISCCLLVLHVVVI